MTQKEKNDRIKRIKNLIGEAKLKRDYYKIDRFKYLLRRVKKS